MSHCLNCRYWHRLEDGIVGKCYERELPEESYRFQFERCRLYQEGEQRKPFIEKGYGKRIRDYSNVGISPELEAAQRWIPVSERLPEEGHKVLVLLTDGAISIDLIYGNDFLYENWVGDITHWMPLPKPPEVQ